MARFTPTPVKGDTKYGTKGNCTLELLKDLDLPADVANSIASISNIGISKSTWSTYCTAEIMLSRCSADTGADLSVPFNQRKTLLFMDWLTRKRGVSGATINSYLAGVRQLHIIRGLDPPPIRSGLVKLYIKGSTNRDGIVKRQGRNMGRLPMTPSTMLVLKNRIYNSDRSIHDKRLIWAVATIAFAGAFRIGELLAKLESTFDPDFTLLASDVTWTTGKDNKTTIHISLKCPKESRSAAPTVVDIYQNDGPLCPIKAFLTWYRLLPREPQLPMFRDGNGTPLTGSKLNKIIKEFLKPYTDKSKGTFGTHSFRIGLASMLGALGHADQDIMASGRWSSRAFEAYTKLKRTKRALIGQQISKIISR
jgi:integrase